MDKKFCNFSIDKYELQDIKDNPNLMLLKMYIAHSGYNRNKKNGYRLFITDEAFQDAEKLFVNLPILACLNRSKTDFLEHEYNLEGYDRNGEPIFNYDERIIGCIPQQDNGIHYDDIDGRRYLVAYAIIWKTYCYHDSQILKQDKIKGISMEIEIVDKTIKDDTMYVNKFNPTGIVILGDNVISGMYNTTAELIKFSLDSKNEIINKLNFAYKNPELFSKEGDNLADIEIDNSKDSAIMGGSWHPNKGALFRKIKKSSNAKTLFKEMFAVHEIPENIDDAVESDFGYEHHSFKEGKMVLNEAGVTSAYKRAKQQNLTGEPMAHIERHRKELGLDSNDNKNEKEDFSMTHNEEFNIMESKFNALTDKYCMSDFDKEKGVIFAWCCDDWNEVVKIPYTFNEDALQIDLSKATKVYRTTIFVDAEPEFVDTFSKYAIDKVNTLKSDFAKKETDLLAKNGELSVNFSAVEKELNDLKTEHETLKSDFAKKDETITELNNKIVTFAETEKINKAKEYLGKSNFSFLTDEDKNSLVEKSKSMEFDNFTKEVFAFIGQKTIDGSYTDKDGKIKFSFMSLPHEGEKDKDEPDEEVDVFNKLEKKLK